MGPHGAPPCTDSSVSCGLHLCLTSYLVVGSYVWGYLVVMLCVNAVVACTADWLELPNLATAWPLRGRC